MEESSRFVTLAASIALAALLVGIIMGIMAIGQTQQTKVVDKLGEMNVQYDISSIDGEKISGSAIHALIARGVPVKTYSNGPNLTREEARTAFISTRWYTAKIISGNEDIVLIS